ncbi:pantoate--beta-alanine ligase [Methyloterricola oryzae]|uniref:pantoate--beta-alanine ligase n=1 Tax=Methyloterricola oryzae TaxID=1495050 RepID=UPI0005EB3649|nr:pantoate--beta-alanine ligase [Methyloterricola oryzae]
MQTVETIAALRAATGAWRQGGERIALVPTMGNLHEGHLHLVAEAKRQARRVVVSIFVNPTQFGAGEDFANYPRTEEADAAKLREAGVDLLFLPRVEEMYPGGSQGMSFVEVPGLSDRLCGKVRPGHFRGVATVVCKLFNMVQPDLALFGEKDFQQLAVIRRMTRDLNLPVEIVGVPTVREPSGLAMSSRNGYLSPEEKTRAAFLHQLLLRIADQLRAGQRDYAALETQGEHELREAGFAPDYLAIRRASDLEMPDTGDVELVVLVAARLGKARLIDNISLGLGLV